MKTEQGQQSARWANYFLIGGDNFTLFWNSFLCSKPRHLLFVLGLGFDPRMCSAIQEIMKQGGEGLRNCLLLVFDEGSSSPSKQHVDRVQQNREQLQQLMVDPKGIHEHEIRMWSTDGRRIGARNAASVFRRLDNLVQYTDIVVDISALPRSIYFPLLGRLLLLIDGKQCDDSLPNLHVVVSESVELDQIIHAEGIDDEATYLHGFSGGVDREATAGIPRVWIPILGENQIGELERIYDLVHPDEICPVLPFPSSDPRRGDNLILEYREILFDRFRVEPRNIIYASEKNPFEVYRELTKTINQYSSSLDPLKGCKVVVSKLSSKLLSLGALLTAYEFRKMAGITHVEASGYTMSVADLNEPINTHEELLEMGRKVDATGYHLETYHRRKDGTTIDVEISINGAVCAGQKLIFCVCRDITERKRLEQEREQLLRNLEDKAKELEQIIYVASHDLRSPLVNIQGFTRELDQSLKEVRSATQGWDIPPTVAEKLAVPMDEDIPTALKYILASTSKIDLLLSGLLRLSRLGRAALAVKNLDMNKLMADVIHAFEFNIKEAEVTLEVEGLPSCRGDNTQINQVFSNLIDNSLKFLDPSRPGIIRVSGRKEDGQVIFCVEDNGIGIAPEHREKVFEIFQRLDPGASSGEGLGLTIVWRIIDRHSGKIWLESELGKGSKFFVSLPAA